MPTIWIRMILEIVDTTSGCFCRVCETREVPGYEEVNGMVVHWTPLSCRFRCEAIGYP